MSLERARRPGRQGREHVAQFLVGRRGPRRAGLAHALEDRFGVRHATLQIEKSRDDHCPDC